ncbi:4'-phosphopantetheinyl transferase superfamily protein [Roseivirga sp. BDSF3-8]|uniref:4'-phosphopantetheinyl transferase family protein n=1 Tax=Roseivirga sp. BDSF3-8 TaxID=3241598 RepID=UPI0035319992
MSEQPAQQIAVHYARNDHQWPASIYEKYLALLPQAMQDRIRRFHRWQDAQASLIGKLLLLEAWKPQGLDQSSLRKLEYTEYQRPYLPGHADFNITHSGNMVACAINPEGRIGIDIEVYSDIDLNDFKNLWTEAEYAHIYAPESPLSVFFHYWARKEAVIKADGKGLSIPLKDIEISGTEGMVYNRERFYLTNLELTGDGASWLATDKPMSLAPTLHKHVYG